MLAPHMMPTTTAASTNVMTTPMYWSSIAEKRDGYRCENACRLCQHVEQVKVNAVSARDPLAVLTSICTLC